MHPRSLASAVLFVLGVSACGASSGDASGTIAPGVGSSAVSEATEPATSAPGPAISSSAPSPSSSASASPTTPPPDAKARPACATAKGAKLELLAEQAPGGGARIRVGLHNTGTDPVCVYTSIATHELQHDWLELELTQGAKKRSLRFDDDRDKSAPVTVSLAPGATDWQTFDVAAWAKRRRNGGEPLKKGEIAAHAIYDTTEETEVWAGRLERSFTLRVP
jgi:hypothetical protein